MLMHDVLQARSPKGVNSDRISPEDQGMITQRLQVMACMLRKALRSATKQLAALLEVAAVS